MKRIDNEATKTYNNVTTALGTWSGDTRVCEQGQVIIKCPPVNNRPITNLNMDGEGNNQPMKLSDSSDGSCGSRKTSWGKLSSGSLTKFQNERIDQESGRNNANSPDNSPKKSAKLIKSPNSPDKKKTSNKKSLITWKDVSPSNSTKSSSSSSGSDLEQSHEYSLRGNKLTTQMRGKSSSSSDLENSHEYSPPVNKLTNAKLSSSSDLETSHEYIHSIGKPTNDVACNFGGCDCKNAANGGSPCKASCDCNCSKKCNSHQPDNQTSLTRSNGSFNENGSPKKEKGLNNLTDDLCNNEYFYDEDFTVQFDTNLRESSVTPIENEPTPAILDFPQMVTGSYLSFHNGGSSNVSYNNMRDSARLSMNNMHGSEANQEIRDENIQYDSELSGNSGSRNSTMEMSSSERDMMCSSDMIDLSDGPLFTPTPTHILSTDSLDRGQGNSQTVDTSGCNTSGEGNLNIDCCPRKEQYFLSFDGSHNPASGSETDISLSLTSHDSCQGNWMHSQTSLTSHESLSRCTGDGQVNVSEASCDGQEVSSDSFHFCYTNKLSPVHRQNQQYIARENLSGRPVKRLVPLKETTELGDFESCDDECLKTSPTLTAGSKELPIFSESSRTSATLTAGSKELPSLSSDSIPKKQQPVVSRQSEPSENLKGTIANTMKLKSENLFLVGIGKPGDILRKAGVHSHTLPVKKLVSWKQVKGIRNFGDSETSRCVSLPELSTSTSWKQLSSVKGRQLADLSDSFHGKRHSASLLEFYQRIKSQSNPVSPETLNNMEQIFLPNFIGQKAKTLEGSSSSLSSSVECRQCQCKREQLPEGLTGSITKAYTNKRIFDWLKMECSSSSRESNRPMSLGCQTKNLRECATKETIISPQTVTLWGGTKNVGSQFPPVTKEIAVQTAYDVAFSNNMSFPGYISKRDQSLQTSDYEKHEILSILSECLYDDFDFLRSNEGIAKDIHQPYSFPEHLCDVDINTKVRRSKSADEYKRYQKNVSQAGEKNNSKSYENESQPVNSCKVGRSKSAAPLGCKSSSHQLRMGYCNYYNHLSLPDLAFLSMSMSISKEESKESLFDPMKIDMPVPVTIAPKTELENFEIFQEKTTPCSCHKCTCSEVKRKSGHKVKGHEPESGSSSGFSTSSTSSGIDPGYCQSENVQRSNPYNDLERLIFFPPHTSSKTAKTCCEPKKRAHSVPAKLSDCVTTNVKMEKYANEVHPHTTKGQGRINQKWNHGSKTAKNVEVSEKVENLYSLEEEQTPLPSPEQHKCFHSDSCLGSEGYHSNTPNSGREQDFTESDFYRVMINGKHLVAAEGCCYGDYSIDSDASSSESYVPNNDKKPLKSCLRKQNQVLRSRSMSDTDKYNLNFEDVKKREKLRNRHSYACDEVYVVTDEYGQLMMYQADDAAEPVMFYLDKDGECHMTEGGKPEHEIPQTDDISGSDSSTDRESTTNKRKSVSFASEVSFQSISPALSPKIPPQVVEACCCQGQQVANGTMQQTENGKSAGEAEEAKDTKTTQETTEIPDAGCHSNNSNNNGSTSSSDSPPEEFPVTMDTNDDDLLSDDIMKERIARITNVSDASDVLVAHFARSIDTFDKLRLGNTAETPEIGDLVLTELSPVLTFMIGNGMKRHLSGFQMFGRVQVTVWKIVEASVEIAPQTRALTDLVAQVKQLSYLSTHQQKFDAFIFGLLNSRLLDYWIGYLRQKVEHLTRFYETEALLLYTNGSLRKYYDTMIVSTQPLAILPFQLDMDYIRQKGMVDSKIKPHDMIGSVEGAISKTINQNTGNKCHVTEMTNENPSTMSTEVTTVLELTASKALNWLASAALPMRKTPTQESKPFELSNQITESASSANQMFGSFSFHEDDKKEANSNEAKRNLTKYQLQLYSDAKSSKVDCDHIMSPTESIQDSMKSSTTSQTGPMSLFSAVAAKLDYHSKETSANQSILSPTMTGSITSFVSKLFGATSPQKQPYRKNVTEYMFDKGSLDLKHGDNSANKLHNESTSVDISPDEVNSKTQNQSSPTDSEKENKKGSFDIVNLFDKLLLPKSKMENKKSKSRWSWNLASWQRTSQKAKNSQKMAETKSDSAILKTGAVDDSSIPSEISKDGVSPCDVPPPKPPRLCRQDSTDVVSPTLDIIQSLPEEERSIQYDINSNASTL